ncbi:thioesterase family protein [Streptomyces sp. TRM 70351]|uniref:thioesterase family protein n=1 Tax=Streptomyces sp. TRM 70351 TaxID=3116552 RepID=UPI002E7BDB62|nr:thioesterase family protein [Streptomyces sp. TRM 70351]MEE1927373.1 thioesterase family protein [Streptomyces sp. TRM 70351]
MTQAPQAPGALRATSRATIGDSEFDRDTRVERREAGHYAADLPAGWAIGDALNGGYLLAVVGRALGDALAHPDPFTVTAHYLTATRPGPALVRTDAAPPGRTLSAGSATLVQREPDGTETERLRVLATYGDLAALPGDVRTSAEPPVLPPFEQCPGAKDHPGGPEAGPPIAGRLDLRLDPATAGWALGAPSGRGEIRAWFALADGRDLDPLALLLAVDALPPTAFELGLSGWVPTVELTAHVRCHPAPGPVRVAITTRNLAGGFLEEDAEVWDSAGRLCAQSRQLARVLTR